MEEEVANSGLEQEMVSEATAEEPVEVTINATEAPLMDGALPNTSDFTLLHHNSMEEGAAVETTTNQTTAVETTAATTTTVTTTTATTKAVTNTAATATDETANDQTTAAATTLSGMLSSC